MAFLFYCIFRAVAADTSRWTPKSARRQNRKTHTQTHRTTTVTLAAHARRGLIACMHASCSVPVHTTAYAQRVTAINISI